MPLVVRDVVVHPALAQFLLVRPADRHDRQSAAVERRDCIQPIELVDDAEAVDVADAGVLDVQRVAQKYLRRGNRVAGHYLPK